MFYDDYLKKNRISSFSKTFLVVDLQESLVNLPNYVEKRKNMIFSKEIYIFNILERLTTTLFQVTTLLRTMYCILQVTFILIA